jgi:hypothetical protein
MWIGRYSKIITEGDSRVKNSFGIDETYRY